MIKIFLTIFSLIFSSQVMAETDINYSNNQELIRNSKKLSIFEEWKSFRELIPNTDSKKYSQDYLYNDQGNDRNNGLLGRSMTLFSFDGASFKFHPKLNSEVYRSVLTFNELSYLKAKIDSRERKLENYFSKKFVNFFSSQGYYDDKKITKKINKIKEKIENFKMMSKKIEDEYSLKGWSGFIPIEGRTGRNNGGKDISCVIAYKLDEPAIIVAFHGSQTGSLLPSKLDDETDWGSNRDFMPVRAYDLNIQDIDPSVFVHRGIANNLSSVQNDINEKLISLLNEHEVLRKSIIIFTGHSKGGGMASLSAPIFKSFLNNKNKKHFYKEVHVAAVLFSSPRVFYGKDSKLWVSNTLGEENILRIHVAGDPVAHILNEKIGYHSVGWLIEDSMKNIKNRSLPNAHLKFNDLFPAFFYQESHYLAAQNGQKRNFASHLVAQYDEILNNNLEYLGKNEKKLILE